MKKLLITASLIATTGCEPLSIAAGGAFTTFRVSQAVNHIEGGLDCQTLTENAYQRKLEGELSGKIEDGIYTALFFPVDTTIALATGKPELIGSHGAVTDSYINSLPQFCRYNENGYGGHKYNGGRDE